MVDQLEVIREYVKAHPTAGGLVLGGVAVCAGLAMVTGYGVDLNSDMPSILKLIALGCLLAVLGYITLHPILMPIVACCLLVLGVAYVTVLGLAQVYPENETLECLAAWNCRAAIDEKSASQAGSDQPLATEALVANGGCLCSPFPNTGVFTQQSIPGPSTALPSSSEPSQPFGQLVYVQFAGAITRDAVRTFMKQLRAAGWEVQGVDGGGERTTKADGLSVVRHAPADKDAAVALVALLNEWKVIDRTFAPDENPLIQAGSLEIWMGR